MVAALSEKTAPEARLPHPRVQAASATGQLRAARKQGGARGTMGGSQTARAGPPLMLPPGATLPFPWVRVHGNRAYVSGHAPQAPDGSVAQPSGKVDSEVTLEQAYEAARLTGLAILGRLQRELGTLNRVNAWLRAFGMVNVAPGFDRMPAVINGFTDLILAV